MEIKNISLHELKKMNGKEGLVLQGCGGDLQEWVDGINDMLTENEILRNGSRFEKAYTFKNEGLTCLLFPFDGVQPDVGKLAIWRLETRENFGSTWLSDYVPNNLGGFIEEQIEDLEMQKNKRPKCLIMGADSLYAWSAPHPILEKLSEMYPDITFEHEWADEDIGSNYGRYAYFDGERIEEYFPESSRERIEFAAHVMESDPSEWGLYLNASETDYVNFPDEEFEIIEVEGQSALFTNSRIRLQKFSFRIWLITRNLNLLKI